MQPAELPYVHLGTPWSEGLRLEAGSGARTPPLPAALLVSSGYPPFVTQPTPPPCVLAWLLVETRFTDRDRWAALKKAAPIWREETVLFTKEEV